MLKPPSLLGCFLLLSGFVGLAQVQSEKAYDVTAHIHFENSRVQKQHPSGHDSLDEDAKVVVWLEPENRASVPAPPAGSYTMVQQDKRFVPHLLVIPAGSVVAFPNRDPYFHNVFSLFNGKRFDLGLYQSGQSRTVNFNRVGVSYIFCNIHPEMASVIITLDTPYYAVPNTHGDVSFHNVKEGTYVLHAWTENSSPEKLKSIEREITVDAAHNKIDEIAIPVTQNTLENHTNKFGQPYDTHTAPY